MLDGGSGEGYAAASSFCSSLEQPPEESIVGVWDSHERALEAVADGDASHLVVPNVHRRINELYMEPRLHLERAFVCDAASGVDATRPILWSVFTGSAAVVEPDAAASSGARRHRADLVALAAVVGAALIWSSSYSVTKVALRTFPPFTIGLLRFVLASALLAALVRRSRHRSARPGRRDFLRLATGGVLGTTIYFAIENTGVNLATASDAALLVAAYPAITIFLEMVLYRRRASAIKAAGVAVAIAGVYLIVSNLPRESSPHRLAGDILLVVSGVVWAFYNFATRAVRERYSTVQVIYYQTVAGTVAFVPLALIERSKWQAPHLSGLVAVAQLGVFCSVAAFFLYAFGLKRLEASTAVGILNLVPVFGVIIPILFLGESLTTLQLVGGAVVIGGVTLGIRGEEKFRRLRSPVANVAPVVPAGVDT